jgi:ribosome maturation factor RimP
MTSEQRETRDDLPGRIAVLAEPLAAAAGIDLVDVEVTGQRGRRVVRLVADADDGLDIDRIAQLSRAVGEAIDDVVTGAYTLEVTSPGTDRPLRRPRDFARNVGREVRVQRTAEADIPGEVVGVVVDVTDTAVVLEIGEERVAIDHADIDHGKVVLPW